jgi:hypothetical protein
LRAFFTTLRPQLTGDHSLMRRFTDRGGLDWSAFESARPGGLPNRRQKPASVTVAFKCDDGTEVAMDLPLGALEGLTDEELILLLTRGLK